MVRSLLLSGGPFLRLAFVLLCAPLPATRGATEQGGPLLGRVSALEREVEEAMGQPGEGGERGMGAAGTSHGGGGGSRAAFLDTLEATGEWTVRREYKGVSGVTLVAAKSSWACFLVMEDVCHFNQDEGVDWFSGFWYSARKANLSAIIGPDDLCGHWDRPKPEGFSNFHVPTTHNENRIKEKYGVFLSERGVAERLGSVKIVEASSMGEGERESVRAGRAPLRRWNKAVGVLSPHDSIVGHFVEVVGLLSEFSAALHASLAPGPSVPGMIQDLGAEVGGRGMKSVILFLRDHTREFFYFSSNITMLLFGESLRTIVGRERPFGSHECFPIVLFPLNRIYTPQSVQLMKKRAFDWADAQVAQDCASVPGAKGASAVPLELPRFPQVTWLWRGYTRVITNPGDVLSLMMKLLELPVHIVNFGSSTTFLEVVQTMQRTAVMVGMHGGAFANAIFLPEGSSMIEILPYKMEYEHYWELAVMQGALAYQWKDPKEVPSSYTENCYTPEFARLSIEHCWARVECMQCVRDHARTTVDPDTFLELLEKVKPGVRKFVEKWAG